MTHSFPTRRSSDLAPWPMADVSPSVTPDLIRGPAFFLSARLEKAAGPRVKPGVTRWGMAGSHPFHSPPCHSRQEGWFTHGRTPCNAGANRHILAHHERSEEHTSEHQSLMRLTYAVFCLKKTI